MTDPGDVPWWADEPTTVALEAPPSGSRRVKPHVAVGGHGGANEQPPPGRDGIRRWWAWALIALVVVVCGVTALVVVSTRSDESADESAQDRRDRDEGDSPSDSDDVTELDVVGDDLACAASGTLEDPITGVSVEPLSRQREREIGDAAILDVLAFYPEVSDRPVEDLLDDLLDALDPEVGGVDFDVTLVASTEVNAFALPGGHLFFTTAIVELLDDDELAFIMGHEIAHVACRHVAHQLEREALVVAALESVVGGVFDVGEFYESEGGQMLATLGSLSFSRGDESESDLVSVDLMRRANYELSAAPSALRVLLALETEGSESAAGALLSTHPPTRERIADVEDEIAR